MSILNKNNVPAAPSYAGPRIYIDVTDLVEYISHNTTYSGIQRVAAQILRYAYQSRQEAVVPVLPRFETLDMQLLSFELFMDALGSIEDGTATRASLDEALVEIMGRSIIEQPKPGDTYFMPGAFWIYESHDYIIEWKKIGVTATLFVHDLIQISNPEYVHADANKRFLRSFVNTISVVDNIIANSNYVADDVRTFINEYIAPSLLKEVPVLVAQLATELPAKALGEPPPVSSNIRRIADKPYVLCVGTLEIRKNNLYLVKVWEELRRHLGEEQVPNLIYVGKKGWDNEPFFNYIEERGYLDHWVFLFERISDVDLSYLYDHCAFTAYVSFAEGWGLPVGESFVHGKHCVTSNVTSMPEVGGIFADYINPYDLRSGVAVFGDLLKNPERIQAAEKKIKDQFKIKTWFEFSAEIFNFLDTTKRRVPQDVFCRIPAGVSVAIGDDNLLRLNAERQPLLNGRMARIFGWHQIEDWGCWAAKREARLEFVADLKPGQKIRLYLELTLPGDLQALQVVVKSEGLAGQDLIVTKSQSWYTCDALIDQNGTVGLSLVSVGKLFPNDARGRLYFGLKRLSYCLHDDLAARVMFMEQYNGVRQEVVVFNTTEPETRKQTAVVQVESSHLNIDAMAAMFSIDEKDITIGQLGLFRWLTHHYYLGRARKNSRNKNWKMGGLQYAALLRNGTMTAKSWVQYGHMLNEQGLLKEAVSAYAAGYHLLPNNEDIRWHYETGVTRLKTKVHLDKV